MNSLTAFAKTLRKSQTTAERLLWSRLRAKQLDGMKFKRQQPIGSYIVDFVVLGKKVIIEIDGGQHNGGNDAVRDSWLRKEGYRILRFWNNDVLGNIQSVLARIVLEIQKA